jgi:ribonuclease HI
MAEYEALVNGLCITAKLGVQQLYIRGDFEIVINQIMGELMCSDSHMVAYSKR